MRYQPLQPALVVVVALLLPSQSPQVRAEPGNTWTKVADNKTGRRQGSVLLAGPASDQMLLLDVPLVEAAENVVPVAVTAAKSVCRLRDRAGGRCISGDKPGMYAPRAKPSTRRRKISRDPSVNRPWRRWHRRPPQSNQGRVDPVLPDRIYCLQCWRDGLL